MSGSDPHERARSDDRAAALDLIEAAHRAGRIGSADRTLRKNNVATAVTLGELDLVIRDLRIAPDPMPEQVAAPPQQFAAPPLPQQVGAAPLPQQVGVAPTPPEPTQPVPQPAYTSVPPRPRYVVRRRGSPSPLLFFAMLLAGLGVAVSVFLGSVGAPDFDIAQPDESQVIRDPYRLNEQGIDWILRRYRDEFGTSETLRVVLYDSYVIVDVPTDDGRARHTSWIVRAGEFTRMADAVANSPGHETFDLNRVDRTALVRNIGKARRSLGVEGPRTIHVIIGHDSFEGRPTVAIHVSNDALESGYLSTDLRGRELRSFPFTR